MYTVTVVCLQIFFLILLADMAPSQLVRLFFLLCCGVLAASLHAGEVAGLSELDYDHSSHLQTQWILYTPACDIIIRQNKVMMESPLIKVATINPSVALLFRDISDNNECFAARLVKGMLSSLASTPLDGDTVLSSDHAVVLQWLQKMLRVEIGWISYWAHDISVNWINFEGKRHSVSILKPGEKHTFWTQSYLGHQFELTDVVSGELVGSYVAEFDSFYVVGTHVLDKLKYADPDKQIEHELKSVYYEPDTVKRTFSKLGFMKGKLPPDVWSSISAYYFNNMEHKTFEEQAGASVFINWWEVPCYFIGMPWGLKKRWQERLLTLVQAWIGHQTPLEQTDIYGIRRYEKGARLLSHVDRITTHAVSLIINVAQEEVNEPWMVEIYDFAGRLHEIEMKPGDVIYYEVTVFLIPNNKP